MKRRGSLCTPGVSSRKGLGWPRRPPRSTHLWTSWLGSAPHSALSVHRHRVGLAGLCAAYELEARGHEVVVLEAHSRRIGGRVYTQRFGVSLSGELGASPRSTLCAGIMLGDLGSRSADSCKPIPWLSISYVGTVYVGRTRLGSSPSTSYRPQSVTKHSPTYGRKPCSAN